MPDTADQPPPKPGQVPEETKPENGQARVPKEILPKLQRKSAPKVCYSSKDYIEQLRTIHFALLAVSAGLLLLILSARPFDPQKASLQMEGILWLKGVWTPDKLAANFPVGDSGNASNGNEPLFPLTDPLGARLNGWRGEGSQIVPIEAPQPGEFIYLEEDWSFPDTLDYFRLWWNALGRQGFRFSSVQGITLGPTCTTTDSRVRCEIVEGTRASARPDANWLHIQISPVMGRAGNGYALSGYVTDQQREFGLHLNIPILHLTINSVSQQAILTRLPDAKPGNFATSFPDLYQATNGPLQYLDLVDVQKHLNEDRAASSGEVFEVLGLKIPTEQITGWGPAVILCILLYLYVYLRALKSPLEPSDDAWNVGWFAACESFLPRSIYFVTVWVLPGAAVLLLAKHALSQRLQQTPFRWHQGAGAIRELFSFARDFPAVPFIIIGCMISLLLGYLNWSNRPRIRMEPAPSRSQLFE